ncbi:ATP-binding protein [Oceanicoccus sp. KOV_DT_Chl]|uniref:ATP-binding protein n=1 Tax=Oceanicoccus sp. KOV_DT_Chl TaxID=1904639 RepID=UPI000C7C1564|nr:ATP-binding protein [Oceanicoccus sp. KOV_DT_Chl]
MELAKKNIQEALDKGHKRFEWVHQRTTGEPFYTDVLLSPTVWKGEKVIQAIVRDISFYKAIQENLQRQKEQSDLAAQAKSEFLAVMSHEIRTPIHGILGAQELLMTTQLDSEQRELATLVIDSAKSLLRIINDVLDFSKIDAGKLALETVDFSPKELVTSVYQLFKVGANNKSIRFTLDIPTEDTRVVGDPTRIQQILTNLVSNAIKFTNTGGQVEIKSSLQPAENNQLQWLLTVSDTGIGMTAEQQHTIFDMFTQADSSITRSFGGTGLGLSISKALADLMNGTIRINSQPDLGSTFELALAVTQSIPDSKPESAPLTDLNRNYLRTVLVAEDNVINQQIIRKKLTLLGLTSIVVNNGKEAIEAYTSSIENNGISTFAMILMDVQMPIMNGLDTTRALRAQGCKLPIIALTADVQLERKQQCLQAGMQGFVGKPYEMAKLIALCDEYLEDKTES